MSITFAWNNDQQIVLFTPRLSIVLSLLGILALGLFTLMSLLLGSLAGVLYLLWVSVAAVVSLPFVLPTLSAILLCFGGALLLFVMSRLLLAILRQYHATSAGKGLSA